MVIRFCRQFTQQFNVHLLRKMSSTTQSSIFMPPLEAKGMTELDASKFTKQIEVPYIKVPSKIVGRIVGSKLLQEFALRRNKSLKYIMNGDSNEEKLMLFDPDLIAERENAVSQICDAVKNAADVDVSLEYKQFELTYADWDVKRCLRAVLPDDLDFSGHTQIGHILHLNLREDLMPYKRVIGQILLDKISYAKTVVNKLDQISSEFRFFELELLAGEPNYIATVSENDFKFKLDFSKVFWNSRLNNEHTRIVSEISKQTCKAVVFDVFAGVGPFVVPAVFLNNTIKVYANDLNPSAVEYLNENLKINKASTEKIAVYNLDGAEFIRTVLPIAYKEHCLSTLGDPISFHVLMNLPALAVSFLPAFKASLIDLPTISPDKCEFIVHCYMFVKANEDHPEEWYEEQAVKMINDQIQFDNVEVLKVTYIRNVANRKNMYCVKFKLPVDYLFTSSTKNGQSDCEYAVAKKKQKIEA